MRCVSTSVGFPDFTEFRHFAYHCQFAPLNDTLTNHLRSLAHDPRVAFNKPLSSLLMPQGQSSLLQSILYFLQVISRQVSRKISMNALQSDLIPSRILIPVGIATGCMSKRRLGTSERLFRGVNS